MQVPEHTTTNNRPANQQDTPHPEATQHETGTLRYLAPNPGQPHPEAFNENLHARSHDDLTNETWQDVSRTMSQNPLCESSPCYIICLGNPGVGKSTILNTLIGSVEFPSGLSFVEGFTKCTAKVEQVIGEETYILVDTPGLDDLHAREEAAREISSALSVSEARFRIIFTVTLEAGRVRASDMATLDAVVTGLDNAGLSMAGRFSVLINKCEKSVYEMLEDYTQAYTIMSHFNYICHVTHVGKIPEIAAARGARNTKLQVSLRESLREFIANAPEVETRAGFQVTVPIDLYERRKGELTAEIRMLENALSKVSYRLAGEASAWRNHDARAPDEVESETPANDAGAWGDIMRFLREQLQTFRTHSLRILGLG